ncbi:Phage integrase family protein [Limimonas halophila]|uniref:Phage integrase family protein n=1 Tax=Limimonas halophila TaxID=1082479 RepID=A0A1G7MBJ3_9PROT|nr:tyrosine-type recombinase/integrase [Limimonas halophila]SDF59168.1 Phage integrase family protein [Limimonas halophila]
MHIHATPDEDPGPARKVKSAAGWRRIPIHETVLALGFLDHVEQQRLKGERRVFPELKPGGTAQRYGYKVSKDFSRYAHQLDLAGATFHGLRHTAITALARAEVYPDTINRLNGHEISGERGRYVKDIPLPQLQAAINAIAYDGIDADLIAGARGASKRRPTPS